MTALEWVGWIAMSGVFGAVIVEGIASRFVLRDQRYDVKDTAVNLAIAAGYLGSHLVIGAMVTAILLAVWSATPARWSMAPWWHWLALFLVEDLLYYWSHRASHRIRVMWASHAVHHNSPVLNLSTGLRNSWGGALLDWVFFVPMAALGFHPLHIAAVIAVAGAWDFMTHTPYVGKLRWLDLVFNTPSNHRVHHAMNPQYVDKNLGGALIIWDRLFGTYQPEVERARYGIDPMPRRPHNPVYLELYLWAELVRDAFGRRHTAAATAIDSDPARP